MVCSKVSLTVRMTAIFDRARGEEECCEEDDDYLHISLGFDTTKVFLILRSGLS